MLPAIRANVVQRASHAFSVAGPVIFTFIIDGRQGYNVNVMDLCMRIILLGYCSIIINLIT